MALEMDDQVQDYNIGSEEKPHMIKLSKGIPLHYKYRYLDLLKTYKDVFSWSYDDLKMFDTNIIQHKVPLKSGMKPYKQKLKQINQLLLPSIEREVKKFLHAKIIIPLIYSKWVANLVPTWKNNEDIRLCVDFRNLNRESLKDNYQLPKMDNIL